MRKTDIYRLIDRLVMKALHRFVIRLNPAIYRTIYKPFSACSVPYT